MLKKILLPTFAVMASAFLFTRPDSKVPSTPPKTVPSVNLSRYAGVWYEIASIPMIFQTGCVNTRATYTPQQNNTVKVNNYCQSYGIKNEVNGTAFPEDDTGSKLQVSFPISFGASSPYWVVRLGEDYEYAVVSQPNYRYIWILSRKPEMSKELYDSLIESLSQDGYPVQKIKRTLQNQNKN